MTISASLVKELRERTGAGMMECKKALADTGGDIEAAIELMRKSGQAKAAKKAGRTAADGVIVIRVSPDGKRAVMVEVNCETDFVAKDANFQAFADAVADCLMANDAIDDVAALGAAPLKAAEPATVEDGRQALIAKIGENMHVRRFVRFATSNGHIASYRHGVRIGVLVDHEGGSADLGKDVAMHIAASNPLCVDAADVPAETVAKEREIYAAQAAESGKPDNIVEKMVDGRIRKFLEEVTLSGQPFVKDPETTVGKLLAKGGARVVAFRRFEVGEGVEKKQSDFAAEVAEAAAAASKG
ncbi:MAG: translation elongation factor Ts [Gammaproteobacteria bacterium]|jgi:elongation factor Ts|nr:translation elongation factor Ts [Gammaproteobacteria bacterium]